MQHKWLVVEWLIFAYQLSNEHYLRGDSQLVKKAGTGPPNTRPPNTRKGCPYISSKEMVSLLVKVTVLS
jgi:hypothetical protein